MLSNFEFECVADGRPKVHIEGETTDVHEAFGCVVFMDPEEDADRARARTQRCSAHDVAANRKL